jgi:5-formyltetrahydrofolate cyclo-ligase
VDYANEPPTRALIEKALKTGKTVLVPKIGKNNSLSFHSVESLSELKKNERGILEPTGEKNGLEPSEIDLVLVPGIVFDEQGNRLGSGKGFFDRSLSDMKKAFRVGLAFEEFVVAELPTEAHDAKMHALVTEKKTRFFEQKK